MQQLKPFQYFDAFRSFLEAKKIGLTFTKLGDGWVAVSPTDAGRGYAISKSRDGWSAEVIGNGGKRQEIFRGQVRYEAAFACMTHEAMKHGLPELAFKHVDTGLSMKNADLLKDGSVYVAENGSRITVHDAVNVPLNGRVKAFACQDAIGNDLGTHTDLKLAIGFLSVMNEAAKLPAQTERAAEAPSRPFQDAVNLTLRITEKPLLTETASGFAQLILKGTDLTTGNERSIPVRGDRAKSLSMVLSARVIGENAPADIALQGKLKPLEMHDARNGATKTVLAFEATGANVLPSRQRRDLGREMQVA